MQQQPSGQRQIQKDVGKNNSVEPVYTYGRKPDKRQDLVYQPASSEDRQKAEDGNDHRKKKRRSEESDEQTSPRKTAARQRPRHRDRQETTNQSRKERLPNREA